MLDFLKAQREARTVTAPAAFAEARQLYEQQLDNDPTINPQSRQYRRWCIRKLELSWPGLKGLRLDQISTEACREWAAKLSQEIACHYYNNTIATLRLIIAAGLKDYSDRTGARIENPAAVLSRVRVTQKELQLPEPDHFRQLIQDVARASGGWGPRAADMIEFLAYSGMRASSEAPWVTWEDVDWQRKEIVVRGSPETGTKNREIRRIPLIPDFATSTARRWRERSGSETARIANGIRARQAGWPASAPGPHRDPRISGLLTALAA